MRLPSLPPLPSELRALPLWPPLLAIRGPGARSALHAHHAMHFVIALSGELRVRSEARGPWTHAPGVLTAPDSSHAIEADGLDVLLVFLEPESAAGSALAAALSGALRALSDAERRALTLSADPRTIMQAGGAEWTRRAVATLSGSAQAAAAPAVHPRVRRLLRQLRMASPGDDLSLEALANDVGLSSGRLMHVFTESIGIPLRPYLAWLRLQRAAAAIASGAPLASAAQAAGFADAAHMTRTFRRMFGVAPSTLRPGPR
jgi:AraC-like DNA-binding protein